MPVINVADARTVFVLKRSMASGFAGIENPLFYKENTRMLFGDAKEHWRSDPRIRLIALVLNETPPRAGFFVAALTRVLGLELQPRGADRARSGSSVHRGPLSITCP